MDKPKGHPRQGGGREPGDQDDERMLHSELGMQGDTNALLIIEDEKIIYASQAYLKMMGYGPGESLETSPHDIQENIHPEDKERINKTISDSLRDNQPEAYYRFREKTKSGKYIQREDYARFQYDEQGNLIRTYVICREVPAKGLSRDSKKKTKKIKVLIAEDNRMNMLLTQELLRELNAGLVILEAWDGQEAIEMFKKHLPDIVLMDINMPEKDGFQACRTIRKTEEELQLKRRPVIAITARRSPEERERCLDAGMDEYLPKPVQEKDFVRTLSDFLKELQEPGNH